MKSVNLTLWAKMVDTVGDELENMDTPVVLIKNVRVNSFNGISLSTVSRSEVEINPDLGEARQLQDWYELIGKSEKITLLSEGMAINNQQYLRSAVPLEALLGGRCSTTSRYSRK